jgi:hypothetical protein
MTASPTTVAPVEFKPWNSPYLLTSQFQLLIKFIDALNASAPPTKGASNNEAIKELEVQVIRIFSHQMMPAWLALAKSYYPFIKQSDYEKTLVESLEDKLKIKARDFQSLAALIKKVFFEKCPRVDSQYQALVDNIETAMAKLTAVALSTPALINSAHHQNKDQYEGAGPSMSNCISPIETILCSIMKRAEIEKPVIIAATSLLLQMKAIKFHFEQISLIQQLERTLDEKKELQKVIEELALDKDIGSTQSNAEEEQDMVLQAWQSKEEQLAAVKVYKLQKRIDQYSEHMSTVLVKSPKDKAAGAKLSTLILMKKSLNTENVLPSERIKTFKEQLDKVREQLKNHRDSPWIRFFSDCMRILALTCSGVAIYRKLTDRSVNFFKPSHGQRFVENAERITAAP